MSKLENIYVNIIKFGTYIILFVPLLITKQFYFPYIFGKAITIRSIVEVLAVVYILLILLNSRYKPRVSLLFWGVVIFMGVKVLSTLFGVNIYHSFWSNYERMEGLLTLLHFGVLFVILTGTLKRREEWFNLFRVAAIASFLVALYGLGQKIGVSALMHAGIEKVDSTIGNSSYVAAYLVMNFFIIFYLIIRDRNLFWRIFYGLALLVDILVILFTASRGGILALIAGLFLLAVSGLFASRSGRTPHLFKFLAISLIAIIISFGTIIYLNKKASWVRESHFLNKLASISFKDPTIQDRFINWRIGFNGWKERPLLGYGPENYYVPFNKYYNSKTSEPWFDRAHNIIFDQLNSSGILGVASYMFILIASLYYLWKSKDKDFWFSVTFTVLLLSYFFANFFVFDNSNTYVLFFLLLAFINSIAFNEKGEVESEQDGVSPRKPISIFVPIGLLIVLGLSLYFFNIRPAVANNIGIEAYKYSRADYSKSTDLFKRALEYNTFGNPEIRLRIGDWALYLLDEYGEERTEAKETMRFAIEELKKSIKKDEPLNARYFLYLGGLYNAMARIENRNENLNLAFKCLNRAKELSPERIEIYFQIGQTAFSVGDREQAVRNFEKAFKIKPEDRDVQLNLMLAYIYASDDNKTDKQFEILKEFGLGNLRNDQIERLVGALYSSKDLNKAIEILEVYANRYPSAKFYAKLAALYVGVGNKEKAKEVTLKAIELDPDFREEGEAFLEKLEE